jgi:hypothetical protein
VRPTARPIVPPVPPATTPPTPKENKPAPAPKHTPVDLDEKQRAEEEVNRIIEELQGEDFDFS